MNSPENKFYVYALIDPFNRVPFYIGKGQGSRCFSHLRGRANYNARKLKTIANIRSLGEEPSVQFIDSNLTNDEAKMLERYVISFMDGCEYFTNSITYPPDASGRKLSEDHKRILSEKNRGKKLSPEHKRKIGLSNKKKVAISFVPFATPVYKKNQGGRNPNATPVLVDGVKFSCKKEAAKHLGVTADFFRKNFQYVTVDK